MDKQTLLDKINKATITPELRAELIAMVNNAPAVDKNLMDEIIAAIDAEAENLIEEIANAELQLETQKFNKQMDEVKQDQDVDAFASELSKKADELDLEKARAQLK
jgi:hypothetical protein